MRYYVNADDFGKSHERNIAIDAAFQRGLIHTTSLIVNIPEADMEACHLAEEHGYGGRIFFHLNLMAGPPMTQEIKKTAFCNEKGEFCHASSKTVHFKCMAPNAIRAIRAECEAQMKRFRELGFTSPHIDSHEWCICSLPVWLAIRPLLEKYGFTETRNVQGRWLNTSRSIARPYYRMLFGRMLTRMRPYSDWAGPIGMLRNDLNRRRIPQDALVELYVHPYIVDGVLMDIAYLKKDKQIPLEDVCNEAAGYGQIVVPE